MTIKDGTYEGQAIEGKVQYGESDGGTLQIAIDMEIYDGQKSLGQMTTILYFTDKSAVYSFERLRLLGWKGEGAEDIDKLGNIYSTRVPVRISPPEPYTDAAGVKKMGVPKLEILAGGGTIVLGKPVEPSSFKARMKALLGGGGGGGATPNGGGTAPPF